MWAIGALLFPAWLLGTFPSARLVARAHGRDITAEGSGNPGASNAIRTLGWRAGLVVAVLDLGKGALAAGVGLAVGGRAGACALGIAAVLGHVFPVWRRGGKGIATAGGWLLVLYPAIVAALLLVWLVLARGLRKASVASLVVTVALPVLVAVTGHAGWEVAVTAVVAGLVVVRHAANIRRLVRGQESDLVAPARGSGPRP